MKTDVGNNSRGDLLNSADLMRRFTSAGDVGTSDIKNRVGVTGSGTINR